MRAQRGRITDAQRNAGVLLQAVFEPETHTADRVSDHVSEARENELMMRFMRSMLR
jgi:hypothetical protein